MIGRPKKYKNIVRNLNSYLYDAGSNKNELEEYIKQY